MSKLITNILWVLVSLLVIYIIYDKLTPNNTVDTSTSHGADTVTIVINQEVFDSLQYFFEAKLDSLSKTKVKWSTAKTIRDTVRLTDTLYLVYSSNFKLGTDTLGVKGLVTFYDEVFGFRDVVFNHQEKIKVVTDTLKYTEQSSNPFYADTWFYISATLLALLITAIGG